MMKPMLAISFLLVTGCATDDPATDPTCAAISTTPPNGNHNAGMGCLTSFGCHNRSLGLGTAAPAWSYGGTVFKDADGTMPLSGATITVKFAGKTQTAITADNGNFWLTPDQLESPSTAMTGIVSLSACPDAITMGQRLDSGNCNNCHRHGGMMPPIHLPAEE